ncbi:MAG: recombinase A [Armatimonadota bacterium]|nr:recombinase A [Armatimonadota bacterium]
MAIHPLPARRLLDVPEPRPALWTLAGVAGRLVEVIGAEDSAALTLVAGLILDAQEEGEQVAWIGPTETSFFVPDFFENGVDLNALVVVRVTDAPACARTADKLLRSGAFGVVIIDTGADPRIPAPLLARLAALAQRAHAALIFLTQQAGTSSLGSLVSLRVRARRQRLAADRFRCWLEVTKDKRRGPTWGYEEVCRGAPGMR